ncbi:Uncharacterised protein [Mycobacteroides abscessus subsp. abscessus]|uniref:hypothetical protein n=1 Tax=Mycobacteroides abscessus TaxID=36809 RepID=UPI0009259FCE|nr:hypothetical protein [Mycobacteroides abscessus]MBE5451218.1 hypothetical protein [Mycobacteroides abscessus]SHW53147.1 Uncharacterised protein [Mycobacteroides abscessus subsp. abscessus]SHX58415.1 Uncharacterised protein [Mycobacteroides abscessus subsp. abscessus]SIE78513.1 Uncharacterised protein [Mycobacteroides abscessus subsp. abscessus]SII21727.1 Uncharacterised protein [Mycobacteroides abscessus subsp. abscessus]
MNAKMIGAVTVVAGALALPLAACGSSTPAPVVTTVTATTTALAPCPPVSDPGWEKCFDAHSQQRRDAAKQTTAAAPTQPKSSGLPWWAWALIVPAALVAVGVIGIKLAEANDERTISHANARVAELDARPRPVLDYDDYEDDDEDDDLDELPEEDMSFLHRVTDPAPTPAQPAPPASGGNLLSALWQQGQ